MSSYWRRWNCIWHANIKDDKDNNDDEEDDNIKGHNDNKDDDEDEDDDEERTYNDEDNHNEDESYEELSFMSEEEMNHCATAKANNGGAINMRVAALSWLLMPTLRPSSLERQCIQSSQRVGSTYICICTKGSNPTHFKPTYNH